MRPSDTQHRIERVGRNIEILRVHDACLYVADARLPRRLGRLVQHAGRDVGSQNESTGTHAPRGLPPLMTVRLVPDSPRGLAQHTRSPTWIIVRDRAYRFPFNATKNPFSPRSRSFPRRLHCSVRLLGSTPKFWFRRIVASGAFEVILYPLSTPSWRKVFMRRFAVALALAISSALYLYARKTRLFSPFGLR